MCTRILGMMKRTSLLSTLTNEIASKSYVVPKYYDACVCVCGTLQCNNCIAYEAMNEVRVSDERAYMYCLQWNRTWIANTTWFQSVYWIKSDGIFLEISLATRSRSCTAEPTWTKTIYSKTKMMSTLFKWCVRRRAINQNDDDDDCDDGSSSCWKIRH